MIMKNLVFGIQDLEIRVLHLKMSNSKIIRVFVKILTLLYNAKLCGFTLNVFFFVLVWTTYEIIFLDF